MSEEGPEKVRQNCLFEQNKDKIIQENAFLFWLMLMAIPIDIFGHMLAAGSFFGSSFTLDGSAVGTLGFAGFDA